VPHIDVILYREEDGTVLLLEWLDALPAKVQDKCVVRLEHWQLVGTSSVGRRLIISTMTSTSFVPAIEGCSTGCCTSSMAG